MNSLGIYFGTRAIGLVESKNKKLVNHVVIPQANISAGDFEEKVPADIKMIALLQDAFRTYHINAKTVTICISGQDLIIRTFEIPSLPHNELRSAINFEIKKYIPFKLEELVYDFQIEPNKKSKTNMVLFVGVKKEVLNTYVAITNQLNLKVDAIEYAAFSLLRLLKLSGARNEGITAGLCFDLNNEDEINFMVFENDFPLFSRDIVLAPGTGDLDTLATDAHLEKQDKLKNEIRVSQDYYRRKFPDKGIKTLYVISDQGMREDLQGFLSDSGVTAKFVDTNRILGRGVPYSSIIVKGFGATLHKDMPLKIKVNILGARFKADRPIGTITIAAFLEGFKINFMAIFFGGLICAATFSYGMLKMQAAREELNNTIAKRPKVSSASVNDSLESLSNTDKDFKSKLSRLDKLIKNQFYATYPLDIIPRSLPKGAWLTNFSLIRDQNNKPQLNLEGLVYLVDSSKEFEVVNFFLSNLRNDKVFAQYFAEINIVAVDRKLFLDSSVVIFSIECKN